MSEVQVKKKKRNGENGRTSQDFYIIEPITSVEYIPTNGQVLGLLKGISKNKRVLKSAKKVAIIVEQKYKQYGLSSGVTLERVKQKVEALWNSWQNVQKHLNTDGQAARDEENAFIIESRKTFAVGEVESGNPRDFCVPTGKLFGLLLVKFRKIV